MWAEIRVGLVFGSVRLETPVHCELGREINPHDDFALRSPDAHCKEQPASSGHHGGLTWLQGAPPSCIWRRGLSSLAGRALKSDKK